MNENRLPSGFRLKFLDCCDSCPEFEPDCSSIALYGDDKLKDVSHTITCRHYSKCRALSEHIRRIKDV